MFVIGTDQGYLDAPVKINPNLKPNNKLVMMPGERYEVMIDFAALPAGHQVRAVEHAPGRPTRPAPPSTAGTTGRIMEFRVACPLAPACAAEPHPGLPPTATPVRVADPINRLVSLANGACPRRRRARSNCRQDASPDPQRVHRRRAARSRSWSTTRSTRGDVELPVAATEGVRLRAHHHPVEHHLVLRAAVRGRDGDLGDREPDRGRPPDPPAPGGVPAPEPAGLRREGLQRRLQLLSFPGQLYMPGYGPPLDYGCGTNPVASRSRFPSSMTRPDDALRARRQPRTRPCSSSGRPSRRCQRGRLEGHRDRLPRPGHAVPGALRSDDAAQHDDQADGAAYEFNPNGGHGYVWHCHIIDHEDNEMMRPISVFANPSPPALAAVGSSCEASTLTRSEPRSPGEGRCGGPLRVRRAARCGGAAPSALPAPGGRA